MEKNKVGKPIGDRSMSVKPGRREAVWQGEVE